jgi:hypothetical protein
VADGVDDEPGEPADDGAVDADELQVAADLGLDALGGLCRVPALDRRRDELADLAGRLGDQRRGKRDDPLVDLGGQLRVVSQALPRADQPRIQTLP